MSTCGWVWFCEECASSVFLGAMSTSFQGVTDRRRAEWVGAPPCTVWPAVGLLGAGHGGRGSVLEARVWECVFVCSCSASQPRCRPRQSLAPGLLVHLWACDRPHPFMVASRPASLLSVSSGVPKGGGPALRRVGHHWTHSLPLHPGWHSRQDKARDTLTQKLVKICGD